MEVKLREWLSRLGLFSFTKPAKFADSVLEHESCRFLDLTC